MRADGRTFSEHARKPAAAIATGHEGPQHKVSASVRLVRSFSIYALSSVGAGVIPLLLLPVLTRHLLPEEYGIVATLATLQAFFAPPVLWGLPSGVAVEHYRLGSAEFRDYVRSALRISACSLLATLGLAGLGAFLFASSLGVPPWWFFSAPLFALLTLFPQILSSLLRAHDRAGAFAAVELTSSIATVLLSLLFVVAMELHWQGRMYAVALSTGLVTAVSVVWLMRNGYFGGEYDASRMRDALRFGAGLIPHDIANQAIRVSDRLFIGGMLGMASVGQYAVANQISSVMLILVAAFNRAWAPYLFSQLSASALDKTKIVRASYLVIGCAIAFFVLFNLALPFVYAVFVDPKFSGSISYVFWLTLGYLFMTIYMTYIDYIFFLKKTHVMSGITLFNLGCNLALNYLLIGQYGTIGSAYAFALTMLIVASLAFVLSNRLYPMPWLFWLNRNRGTPA